MKKTFVIIFIFLVIIVSYFLFRSQKKIFDGIVYDCQTNTPISGARVQIHVGNSITNLFSDSGRNYESITDEDGKFNIKYSGGDGNVSVDKYGEYLSSIGSYVGGKVRVGMIKKTQADSISDYSISCKRSSDCTKKEIINGVETLTTVCDMRLLKTTD